MTTTVLVGNPRPKSRTFDAAHAVLEMLTGAPADDTIDLAELGPALLDWTDPVVAALVEKVKATRLLVVATPTYKGTYTGLLKLFLDRFGAGELVGVTAIPVMLGGDLRHSLAVEAFLKPVLAEIGASCPTRGLFLVEEEGASPSALAPWLDTARSQLASVLSEIASS